MSLDLTPQDLLTIVQDMARRKDPTGKIVQVHGALVPLVGEIPGEIVTKIGQVLQGLWQRERNLAAEIREWALSSSGVFLSSDVVKSLRLSSREDEKNLLKILSRLAEERVIVRVGNKNGQWRKVETDFEPMRIDLDAPDEEEAKINLPLRLNEVVEIYPKNVIVVAGEKDAGKSCMALNTAYLNRDVLPVRYFNSEMGTVELKKRLRKFPYPGQEWRKIEFIEKSSSFADLILPDALNIVDFLEVNEEAYKVVVWIKEMFDRLRTGLLLVVLQKRSYKDFGVGGEGTLEKARLYLNLERGNIGRIKSAKNWKGFNPRDYICEYRIRNGGELSMIGDWHMDEGIIRARDKGRSKYDEFIKEH